MGKPGIAALIGLAFCLAVGLMLLILACALENNWWPMFALIPYILAPLPTLIASSSSSNDFSFSDSSSGGGAMDFAYFLTSCFVVSGIALIAVLGHAMVISGQAVGLAVAGGIAVYAAIGTYIHVFGESSDGF